ncbi:MAG: tetratricopeptide repeat protein, partial [Betaproteobacteria bacterium]|nr:tetratricopeptide repeat protein [Betaproteobacteria bacterium]
EPLVSPTPQPAQPKPATPSTGNPASSGSSARDQARAATVMQAAATPATAPRIRPVLAIGVIAGVVALGLAIYVYLQITNPGLFIRQQPAPARPPAPLAQGPAPVQPPIATGAVVAPAGTPSATPERPREAEPAPAPRAAPRAPVTANAPTEQRNSIRVSTGTPEPQLDSRLPQAYAALQSGNLDAARQFYGDVARAEPKNINALLGLAAVAMQESKPDDASRLYFSVLDLEPRNAYAQTGLIALMGRADPVSAETRLKQLIAREPVASLYFTLGNLYGDQSRWPEAQLAYFQAHQLEPANPDYAYNLAVGLEHVGQSKLAAGFYQRAVAQAQAKGRAGFNLGQAQDRIRQLAVRPE